MPFSSLEDAHAQVRRLTSLKGAITAAPLLEEAIEAYPDDAELRAMKTRALLWRGKLDEARAYATASHEQLGESAPLLSALAEVKRFEGEFEAAGGLLDRANAIDPGDRTTLHTTASWCSVLGDAARAVELAERLATDWHGDPDAYALLYSTYHLVGQEDDADALLAEPWPGLGHSPAYHVTLGRRALRRQDLPAAESAFRDALSLAPEWGSAWAELSRTLVFVGRLAEAKEAAGYALEINGRDPIALTSLAKVARGQKDEALALELEAKATAAVPFLKVASYGRQAAKLMGQRKHREALAQFHKVEAEGQPYWQRHARRLKIDCLMKLNEHAELRRALDGMQADGDTCSNYFAGRAFEQERDGDLSAAIDTLEAGYLSPNGGSALVSPLVIALAKAGRADRIDQIVRDAIASPPGLPTACARLVMVIAETGRDDQAQALLDAAQRKFPHARILKVAEVGMRTRRGDVKGAARMASEIGMRLRLRIKFWKLLNPLFWIRIIRRRRR